MIILLSTFDLICEISREIFLNQKYDDNQSENLFNENEIINSNNKGNIITINTQNVNNYDSIIDKKNEIDKNTFIDAQNHLILSNL